MIYEVIYNPIESNDFEDHVKNVFKLDFENDCFVYFHLGENASKFFNQEFPNYLSSYQYIKSLENKFNVNINMYDLSYLFDNLKINPDKEEVQRVLYYLKGTYFNHVEKTIFSLRKK